MADVTVRAVGTRYVIAGWPAPWTTAGTGAIEVAIDGATVRRGAVGGQPLARWFSLGVGPDDGGAVVDRQVRPAQGARPAELALVWPSLADDLTLRLACGVGPIELAYHHHGTVEELRAVRVPQ